MTETLHIVRKDLKQLRWPLLVWVALLIARVASWSLGLSPSRDPGYSMLLQRSTGTVESLLLLVLAFVAARLVHEEPLVGWNAFWFTRPHSRNALVAAKLLLAAVVFVALPLVADVATMAIYHVGPRAQVEAAMSFSTDYVTWMLLAIAMAALTPSLGTFVLATVASFTGLSLVTMAIATVSAYLREPATTPFPIREFNPAPGIIATLIINAAMAVVIVYQYRQRRWRTAAAIAVAGIVFSLVVPLLPFQAPAAIDPGPWAGNPSASPAVIERRSQTRAVGGGPPKRWLVYAPVRLKGIPQDYAFGYPTAFADSTLTLPDGTKVSSRQYQTLQTQVPDGDGPGTLTMKRRALGGATIIPGANEGNIEYWPALIALTGEQYTRLRGTSVRLDTTLQILLTRMKRRALLPLEAGAAHDEGLSRVELIRIERGADGVTVTVRRWRAYSPFENRRVPSSSLALYNPSRGEALTPTSRGQLPVPSGARDSSSGPVLSFTGAMSAGLRHNGFSMDAEQVTFPDRIERGRESRTIDASWFDGAQLAVLETSYAGTVTRSVTIEDFVIPAD